MWKIFVVFLIFLSACFPSKQIHSPEQQRVKTFAGFLGEFGEPFGIAIDRKGSIYVSDGQKGAIFRVSSEGALETVTDQLNTPSHIAFNQDGFLIVADTGSHTIKKVNVQTGMVEVIAGVEGRKGYLDGEARSALFNAPIGVAVLDDRIFVADTYNDKIRVIEDGLVKTLAGSVRGYLDGTSTLARFDTPCAITFLDGENLLVADFINGAIRKVSVASGVVTTLIQDLDAPTAIAIDEKGAIYIADGDSIKVVEDISVLSVRSLSFARGGFEDGQLEKARFLRPSSIFFRGRDMFVADSDNRLIRVITSEKIGSELSNNVLTDVEMKNFASRWCYEPAENQREIAGTFGEIRGEISQSSWFHNGIDITGYYGERAYFIQDEKVLLPSAVFDFGGLREGLRLHLSGYVHIKLGRDRQDQPFGDERFQFSFNEKGKVDGLRVARGTVFYKGEVIGTLNEMNHVHLIIGHRSSVQNPFKAVNFPNISDNIPPVIEGISLVNEFWQPVSLSNVEGKLRILVRAFDRMNGNPKRRKLGVYRIGYQVLKGEVVILNRLDSIVFDRIPEDEEISMIYAPESRAGATREAIFNYIATSRLAGGRAEEAFFNVDKLEPGSYRLLVVVADFFGNETKRELGFTKN